jgi:hypothetical protein
MTDTPLKHDEPRQKILVFQQNGSAEAKIAGIQHYGNGLFDVEVISVDSDLPSILDETDRYLPQNIQADIVLDFLKHPDLSSDLTERCRRKKIPVVASGKKLRIEGMIAPPT